MTPQDFIDKWRTVELKERSASQSHFNDLCHLLGVDDPIKADPKGDTFAFEKGASKTTGGEGWADVWKDGCFAWEYKGKRKDLDRAFAQLQQYAIALNNPPLLIVSDMDRIRIHTNWTNTVQKVHEIHLTDLVDAAHRDLLRACFEAPDKLKPQKTRQVLTEEAAQRFALIAQRLRGRGHDAHQVAHFVNRLVFCMFAEDVGLLPDNMFARLIELSRKKPETFADHANKLFAAMRTGGDVGFERVEWFNGGLFDTDDALPLTWEDLDDLKRATMLDWSDIDPSVLGTLFERGLDPTKRSQLGAHYTDRDKIMQIVRPVIVEPLLAEWEAVKAQIIAQAEGAPKATDGKLLVGAGLAARNRALDKAEALHVAFLERLRAFRVLDPACGSGNFLYIALTELKNIEHRANLEAEALGLPRPALQNVGPENVLGIEINPYAAELARVSVWIGEIQWMRRNGFEAARNPILRTLTNIANRDAILNADGTLGDWPKADAIIGNPPFLGSKLMLDRLGEDYTRRLRAVLPKESPAVNLVTYWFFQAGRAVRAGTRRVGLVATNMIRSPINAAVAKHLYEVAPIRVAWGDEPWVVDGADIRVSLVVCAKNWATDCRLDGKLVREITADLKSFSVDLSSKRLLPEMRKRAVRGVEKGGPFDLTRVEAEQLLRQPINPNGRRNEEVVKRYVTVSDIVGRGDDGWIVDFFGRDETSASEFEAPFALIESRVRSSRAGNREERQISKWWLFRRSGEQARSVLSSKSRILTTGLVTKHRVFRWQSAAMIPDTRVILIDTTEDLAFGILSSRIHELWTLSNCQFHGVGNDPVYTPTDCFETFPFPDGFAPLANYSADPRAQKIAGAAARLNELRENWLNPADLVTRVPEVVAGYPDRIAPKSDAAAKELSKRTLTNLYNARPAWLVNAHRTLDEAVAEAYGWGDDWRSGALTDDEILARLFRLNQERSA